ncbi:conserved protein of unknown function [Ectopseudomonas oleovorans]|uniref:Uncharacterized protein n=1 Tax=Ectopseudomonas oleovorans TaxID=301 RepID=A0A653B7A5_ECTOL|nr:conserved protein of unknown function [Pseudomonas oleovorans]
MKVDIHDRPQRKVSHARWRPYAAAIAVSALLSSGMMYLYSAEWGVTIDLQKLKEAFVVNGKAEPKSWSAEPAREQPKVIATPKTSVSQRTNAQTKNEESSAYYVHPKGMPPVDWGTYIRTFNSIFIQHPSCNPHDMKWTQMECSNFRARAMKRFGEEWNKNSYWDGSEIKNNKDADVIVNLELRW